MDQCSVDAPPRDPALHDQPLRQPALGAAPGHADPGDEPAGLAHLHVVAERARPALADGSRPGLDRHAVAGGLEARLGAGEELHAVVDVRLLDAALQGVGVEERARHLAEHGAAGQQVEPAAPGHAEVEGVGQLLGVLDLVDGAHRYGHRPAAAVAGGKAAREVVRAEISSGERSGCSRAGTTANDEKPSRDPTVHGCSLTARLGRAGTIGSVTTVEAAQLVSGSLASLAGSDGSMACCQDTVIATLAGDRDDEVDARPPGGEHLHARRRRVGLALGGAGELRGDADVVAWRSAAPAARAPRWSA